MANKTITVPARAASAIAADEVAGALFQRVKLAFGGEGIVSDVTSSTPLPVTLVGGGGGSSGGLTDAELRASPLAVSGTFWQATQPVSATALPLPTGAATETTLSGINAKLPALSGGRIPVELPAGGGGLTDAELRASALQVSNTDLATIASAVAAHDDPAVSGRNGLAILVRRRNEDAELTVADGDFSFLNINDEGRLKVTTKPAVYQDITGDITAVQATIKTPVAGGTVAGDVSRASNVMAFCTGTFNTVNCTFEGSLEDTGDTNWFTVQAIRSNANTIETTTGNLSAQPAYAWELSVNALSRLRVRCTARTSGTQSWRFKLGTYATEPIPGAQVSATQPVSGTVTGNVGTCAPVLYADTTTVLAAAATYTGTSRDAGTTPAYQRFVARAYASHDGTLRVEDSTDNTTWRTVASIPVAAGATQTIDAMVMARYNRVVYVNGATLQTAFRVTSGYHRI